ncbi:MAG: response regulator transcription factor [Candidatus Dormibacteraeota bacterium]|uniref:DNA-binding response regulator n=1 Tax=Candidatus Aeolococcus gillhamiae TaxID=3127015 RepID=A0A2W5ZDC2_9BACT|nr:response regulator transcription factor [Candidatus Dormibacteraeota bacterium]PZR83333.1 MAG: DNA-binding response regulator [Candidatus Dormibacter sp. RRmetagenome_bin12]
MRILIVEDDRRLLSILQRALREAGMAVDTAEDGEEAAAAATTTEFDVIVMDVMLPRLDGIAATKLLRDRHVRTPILMLTGRDTVDDRVRGLEAGADDYLVKPFALREVVARIRALTRRHLDDRAAILRAGQVELDTAAHLLTVGGQVVPLTAKEFSILEYFLLNKGRLLTRTQVLEHGWPYDFNGGRNLVEVYIGRLRQKLVAAGTEDPFVTVRGSGYRYRDP